MLQIPKTESHKGVDEELLLHLRGGTGTLDNGDDSNWKIEMKIIIQEMMRENDEIKRKIEEMRGEKEDLRENEELRREREDLRTENEEMKWHILDLKRERL